MSAKKPRSHNHVRNAKFCLGMLWKLSKGYVIGGFLTTALSFGTWVFDTLVFTQYIFGSGEMIHSFSEVLVFVAAMLLLYGVDHVANTLYSRWAYDKKMPEFNEKIHRLVFDKAVNVDVSCFEDSDFYNMYTKASQEVVNHVVDTFFDVTTLFSALLSSTYVIYVMFSLNVWIGLLSMLPVIVSYTLGTVQNRANYKKRMELVPDERKLEYVNRSFFLQKYSKEIRLSHAKRLLEQKLAEGTDGMIRTTRKHATKISWLAGLNSTLCFPVLFEGTWLLGAWLVMVKGALTISEFVVVSSAAVSTTWMVRNCTQAVLSIMEHALYIDNLKTFLDYKERIPENGDGLDVPSRVDTLELKHVSFRYKEDSPEVLHDINLLLRAGEITTLVGYNGSGKSTLVKLLMRLYDPTEGVILLNGVDIRDYRLRDYRRLIGTTFQDFQLFSMSVTDNVCMGNRLSYDTREETVQQALLQSGGWERVQQLEHGTDTVLTREFDDNGAQLSGGEGQKIAIARAFAKQSAILILDEPSGALDPVAEHHVFQHFVELCRSKEACDGAEKISVFISHRLSSATIADRVVLLEEGYITEIGTHAQLMERGGTYADMFRKQASNYCEGVTA